MDIGPLVIGLGGISGGGKTSLTCKFEKLLKNVVIIHMDNYYQTSTPIADYVDFYNWDCIESINWDQLINDVDRHICQLTKTQQCSLIIVEGTMILNYGPLTQYFSQQFFITLPHNEALLRRRSTFSGKEPDGYFDEYVWPAFIRCYCDLLTRDNVVFLDGCESLNNNFERIVDTLPLPCLPHNNTTLI